MCVCVCVIVLSMDVSALEDKMGSCKKCVGLFDAAAGGE